MNRNLNSYIKNLIFLLIKIYKVFISPFLGTNCRFLPSCSDYFCEAINEKGIIFGFFLGFKRILKCNPFCVCGYDPVKSDQNKKSI